MDAGTNLFQRAFPLADYWPILREPTAEDKALAEKFCPIIIVDPKLMSNERAVLAHHLGIRGEQVQGLGGYFELLRSRDFQRAAEALFLFSFQDHSLRKSGVNLWILSQLEQFIADLQCKPPPDSFEKPFFFSPDPPALVQWRRTEGLSKPRKKVLEEERLNRDILALLLETKKNKDAIKKFVQELFYDIFPEKSSPTCKIKYHVLHHPTNYDLTCIQYFVYWPIQIIPHHFFDYEPVYVFVGKKSKRPYSVLMAFNQAPKTKDNIKAVLSFFRKRPGHSIALGARERYSATEIKYDFDWSLLQQCFFRKLTEYMVDAYSGKYVYGEVDLHTTPRLAPEVFVDERIVSDHVLLYIPLIKGFCASWHAPIPLPTALELKCSDISKIPWKVDCKLEPLQSIDLDYIEWNIADPFRVPFLYPLLGGKNLKMHFPLNLDMFNYNKNPASMERWAFWTDPKNHLNRRLYKKMEKPITKDERYRGDETEAPIDFQMGFLIECIANRNLYRKEKLSRGINPNELSERLWREIKLLYGTKDAKTRLGQKYGRFFLEGHVSEHCGIDIEERS